MLKEGHSGWKNEAFLFLLFLSGLAEYDWKEESEPFDNGIASSVRKETSGIDRRENPECI